MSAIPACQEHRFFKIVKRNANAKQDRGQLVGSRIHLTYCTLLDRSRGTPGPSRPGQKKTNSISKYKVKRWSRSALVRVLVRKSFAPSLLGNPPGILKPSRSRSPENAAANVRQVGNAACLHIGYGSGI